MGFQRTFSTDDLDLLEQIAIHKARRDFWTFRRYINPKMKVGWWQRQVSAELQRFYDEFIAGGRPALAIQAPPQHGKSVQITEFLAWVQGRHLSFPETCGVFSHQVGLREVYGSFSDRLGVRANTAVQKLCENPRFQKVFPGALLPGMKDKEQCNRDIVEFLRSDGAYFRNTTVGGSITGEGLDLGAVDDPLKGRAEANSPTVRQRAWNWFTDDLFTRFSDFAALLIILTRWHVDDPLGRLQEMSELGDLKLNLRVLKYPALATEDLERAEGDWRAVGEPLFPELKSEEFLLSRKSIMLESSWESLYQQSPFVASGGIFPVDKFEYLDFPPARDDVLRSVRYWDKAGTKDGNGAETSGTLMHALKSGRYVIENVVHGRWKALEREVKIKSTAEADGYGVEVYVEQEPGSGGKESAEATVMNLAGWPVYADRPTGDKALRAEPYAAQVQGGNVWLVRGPWNRPFLEEHEHFPFGKLKDMVDSSSGAFNKLAVGGYNMEELAK